MLAKGHIIISAVISLIFFPSWKAILICFLTGWMIDVDHLFDYFLTYKNKMKAREFIEGTWHSNIILIIFHSWEILPIVLLIFGLNVYTLSFSVGFTQHMIIDLFINNIPNKFSKFFFFYRAFHKFERLC